MSWIAIVFWSAAALIVGASLWNIRKQKHQTPAERERSLNQEMNEVNTYRDISRHRSGHE